MPKKVFSIDNEKCAKYERNWKTKILVYCDLKYHFWAAVWRKKFLGH